MKETGKVICPLCNDEVDKLLYRFHVENERVVIKKIERDHPGWALGDGLCARCRDYYYVEIVMEKRMLPAIGPYFPVRSADDFVVLPVGLRIDADARFTGKGITICLVDSGFCAHPDLVASANRIKQYVDITEEGSEAGKNENEGAWHGTMTSVVCAGDGYLSKGLYKGIACDADLVLIKVQDSKGRISTLHIEKALQWILDHHEPYNIRVVNLSLRADEIVSYKNSRVDQLAESLIERGVSVVAAVGNDEGGAIYPPANAPHVIAVGGIDDGNRLDNENKLYHSSYGWTVDGLMKPELVTHAIWIAAPILPGSPEEVEAGILYRLLSLPDENLQPELERCLTQTALDERILRENTGDAKRAMIIDRIQAGKYISAHSMHVDGTSFAAPIVSSVIAQLLEAEPNLTPLQLRYILFSTGERMRGFPAERQGFGILQPRECLSKALQYGPAINVPVSPLINREKKVIEFSLRNDHARQISLSGSFLNWEKDVLILEADRNGVWKIAIPLLPPGRYAYKFCLDGNTWIEDIGNPYREPDGLNGLNSVLIVEP